MMFREVRKKKNEITADTAKQLLSSARRGVLAVNGDNGYPYAVPINYLYCESENKIYFHGSRAGHKIDSIKACDKVCFTVFGNESIKDEEWAPYVQSVVVFGKCRLIDDQDLAVDLVSRLARKYFPDEEHIIEEVSVYGKAVQMFEIEIEHLSGKEVQER